ncbi:hypothetical protein Bca4012_081048 [Brassica carinata]|uniref:Uncharacterized protein n=1 Tax=Brassica carinata TaxID=52824 RepID=A0A8X7NUX2_BRACI|nr:hypothetical protein Bca52824_091791 [Brassica carinata]
MEQQGHRVSYKANMRKENKKGQQGFLKSRETSISFILMDPVFTAPPSKRWLENELTVDPFLVEALQNPCHRLTSYGDAHELCTSKTMLNLDPWIVRLGRFPIVKTALPIDGRFEHIVLSCNEHQTTPSFGSNEKLNELST